MKDILKVLSTKWATEVCLIELDLSNLVNNSVGIGEHVELSKDIERLFVQMLEKRHLVDEANQYLKEQDCAVNTESKTCCSKQPIGFSNGNTCC